MTLHLQRGEGVAEGLRRIFRTELDSARVCIAHDGRLSDKEIHGARKSVKRARATLRLMRPALDDALFRDTNLALRDIARPLTHVRDSKILLDSLESLHSHYGEVTEYLETNDLEQSLHAQRARSRRELSNTQHTIAQLRNSLRRIHAEAKEWSLDKDGWKLLDASLTRIYRRAQRAHANVCEARSDERLHEWRKQVKHLWHSLQVLTPLRPGRIGELADQAHTLADYLGDDHDLALLRKNNETTPIDEDTAEVLEALIDKRRGDLQDRAMAVGERLLARRPKRFVRMFKRAWREWRKSQPLVAIEAAPSPPSPHGSRAPRARVRQQVEQPATRLH